MSISCSVCAKPIEVEHDFPTPDHAFCSGICRAEFIQRLRLTLSDHVSDAVANVLYYDRKDDEELSREDIDMLFRERHLTPNELCMVFSSAVKKAYAENFSELQNKPPIRLEHEDPPSREFKLFEILEARVARLEKLNKTLIAALKHEATESVCVRPDAILHWLMGKGI